MWRGPCTNNGHSKGMVAFQYHVVSYWNRSTECLITWAIRKRHWKVNTAKFCIIQNNCALKKRILITQLWGRIIYKLTGFSIHCFQGHRKVCFKSVSNTRVHTNINTPIIFIDSVRNILKYYHSIWKGREIRTGINSVGSVCIASSYPGCPEWCLLLLTVLQL